MSEVKRFKPVINSTPYKHYAYCEENEDGIYVRIDDYEAIKAERDALAQEKEAADRYTERLNKLLDGRDATLSRYEAKLAELEKQQAVGTARMELTIGKEGLRYYQCFVDMRPDLVVAELNTGMDLFTRPAPAINLAELVPDEIPKNVYQVIYQECGGFVDSNANAKTIWKACRAAILRNIEDDGK